MDDGTGGGAVSGTTLRVGSGNAGALRLLFALLFVLLLLFSFALASGLSSSISSGEACAFALAFAFTFAGGVIVPPAGNPSSGFPVAGEATCTG